MRVERRRLGTRVRLVLNRAEAREAARNAVSHFLNWGTMSSKTRVALETVMAGPKAQLRILANWSRIGYNENSITVTNAALEKACRSTVAEAGREGLPGTASFRVAVDSTSELTGATFQFWVLDEGGE